MLHYLTMYDNINHLVLKQSNDDKQLSWNQVYLCVKDDNNLRDYSCSPHKSFEQADAYFKQNFKASQSTMVEVNGFLPKQLLHHVLKYKLANSFINIKTT